MNKHGWIAGIMGMLALLLSAPVLAALDTGATAPDFSAPASLAGEEFTFSLAQALADGPVVVYFFPAAYTEGCDLQAHTFSEHSEQFEAAGATIIGVSADSIERLHDFSADPDYCAGDFAVASDPNGTIAATFDLEMMPAQPGVVDVRGTEITHGFLPRVTFVLNDKGEIIARLSSQDDDLTPDQHVTRSLEIVQQLQAGEEGQ